MRCSVCGKFTDVAVIIEATRKCCCPECWTKVLNTPKSYEVKHNKTKTVKGYNYTKSKTKMLRSEAEQKGGK